MPEPANGSNVHVQYGDELITLEQRLLAQDRDIKWLQRAVIGMGGVLLFHALLPGQDLLTFLLGLFGF